MLLLRQCVRRDAGIHERVASLKAVCVSGVHIRVKLARPCDAKAYLKAPSLAVTDATLRKNTGFGPSSHCERSCFCDTIPIRAKQAMA